MLSNKFIAVSTALALVAAPTVAVAQGAAAPLAPADETIEGSELRGIGSILPIFVIAAIVLLIREIVKDRDIGRDNPISP